MCDDDAHARNEWMEDHMAGTERTVFKALVLHLAKKVPGFSVDEFRDLALHLTVEATDRLDRNVMTEWMSAMSRTITNDMLPPPLSDDEGREPPPK